MAINKATLAKEIDGVIEYIYPKTSGDIVVYDDTHSVSAMISMLRATKVDQIEGMGLSSNDFSNAYRDKLDSIERGATVTRTDENLNATSSNPPANSAVTGAMLNKLESKHTYINYTLRASGWTQDGFYMIENEYPTSDYLVGLMVGPMNNDQYEAFSAAHIIGSELDTESNYFKAIGEIPDIDIPVIFDIRKITPDVLPSSTH